MFPGEVEARKNTVKPMFPREVIATDLSAQSFDSLEFLVKWNKYMYLMSAGMTATTIAMHIWLMFTMNH